MKGADKYCKVFKNAEQIGRLYVLPSSHARGATFRIYVLSEGEEVIENAGINPPLNKEVVEVYGVTSGNPGWTETYGWLHTGKWQVDFEEIYQKRLKELKAIEIKRKEKKEAEKIESDKRASTLLADYT